MQAYALQIIHIQMISPVNIWRAVTSYIRIQ